MSTQSITNRLQQEKISKLLLHYTIPAIVGTMVNSLYSIVDRIFIGQGVGALAISGLTLTFPVLNFIHAFGMLVGVGAATRISIRLGRNEVDKAERVLGNALMLSLIFSVLTTVLSLVFIKPLLFQFGGSEATIPFALDYLYIVIPSTIFMTLSFSFNAMMRASGYPRKAMLTMLLGAGINIVLDPIFIFVFKMGIQGAAIATVLSMLVCTVWVMSHFYSKESILHFQRKYLKLHKQTVFSILSIGMSPFGMMIAASFVTIVVNRTLNSNGGDLAVGAYGIVSSFETLLVMLCMGITQGMQPIIGFNYGAQQYDRLLEVLKLGIIAASIITGVGFIFSMVMPQTMVQLFTTDNQLVDISAQGMRVYFAIFFVVGFQIVAAQYFQNIGKAWKSMFLSLTRQVIFLIPGMLILPNFFGLDGVWAANPVASFFSALLTGLFLMHEIKTLRQGVLQTRAQ